MNETDKYFSEKLITHQITPRHEAWEKISAQLPFKKKTFFLYASVAASLLLLLVCSFLYFSFYQPMIPSVDKIDRGPVKKPIKTEPTKSKKQVEMIADKNWVKSPITRSLTSVKIKNIEEKETGNFENKKSGIVPQENIPVMEIDQISSISTIIPIHESGKVIIFESALDIKAPGIKKISKLARILTQVKRFKKGEKVYLNEFGLDKENVMATIKEKFN